MKKFFFLFLYIFAFITLDAQILLTAAQVNTINSEQSAAEGNLYKDTENNVFYIGLSSGLLKIIGDFSKVDASLTGDGTVANPLGIAQMGASSGQVLTWNGTTWTPNTVTVQDATTTVKGVIQLAGDLTGTAISPQIAANAVTTNEILNLTVANADIANNAINSAKIQDGTVANADLASNSVTTIKISNSQVTYAKMQNVTALRLIGNPTGALSAPSEISLGTGLSFTGTVLNTINNGTVTTVTGTSPIVITGTPSLIPNVTITRNDIVTGTSSSSATNPLVLDAGATNAVVGGVNATLTVNNTAALWNANQLQGNAISSTAPTNNQVLTWNGTSWTPANAAPSTTTVSNTVTAPNSLTTTVNGVTGNAVNMVTGVSNTSSNNSLSTTVNGITSTNVNIVNSISNSFAGGQLTTSVNGVNATPVTLPSGTVTSVTGTSPIVITGTPASIPNVTITRNNILAGTSSSSATNPLVLDAGATNAVVGGVNATLTVNNTAALWNANQLRGYAISSTAPTNGQVLSWNGTSWIPANSSSWSLTGNASTNPTTNFLGTTDNQRLVFKTNNVERATFLTNGNFGIGIATPDATLHNNGSTIYTVRSISDINAGGNIETASNSVDIGSVFAINQTTSSQVLTLPTPTTTTSGRMVKVYNTGTTSFTMYSITIQPSKFSEYLWTGSAWIPSAGSTPSNNKKYVISAEYGGAIVTPGPGTSHNGNLYGDNTGAVSPYYYMNYYHWESRSGSGPHTYQVIVRVTLPNDFSEWLTTNAIEFVNMAQTGCSVDLDIYNVTSGASVYNGSAISNASWTTNSIPNSSLTGWVTPGQTVAFIITLSANTNGTYTRIGDLILNYK